MADTMSFALIGALILTLTLVPVLASYAFRKGVREKTNYVYEWLKREYGAGTGMVSQSSLPSGMSILSALLKTTASLASFSRTPIASIAW